jgi:hypothetical protein
MKTKLVVFLFFLLIILITEFVFAIEVENLQKHFCANVSDLRCDHNYTNWVVADSLEKLKSVNASYNQYFVYSDRNPQKQKIMVGFFQEKVPQITVIGWDNISTGNPKRRGYFITPTGVFKNSAKIVGYRALGTKNDKGWRGLGKKNSRVWDFGWQETKYLYGGRNLNRKIRLLLHATDPEFGEPRLGKVDSKGCVRISGKLNYFLDYYGILDLDYENNIENGMIEYLLRSDRKTVKFPGQFMIIGDSSGIFIEEES